MRAMGDLYVIYVLCHQRGCFVYEHAPYIFPQRFLTEDEIAGWEEFYKMQQERSKKT